MKFIYTSDIHGDINKYEKLIYLCKVNNIDSIVVGGDLFSKNFDDRISVQKNFIKNYLNVYFERLEKNNIKFIGIVGNDDLIIPCRDYYNLIKKFPYVYDINMKKVDINGISFIGLNYVLDAPFKRKDNIALEEGLEMPSQWSDEIYVDECQRVISREEWKIERKKCPMMEDLLNDLPCPTEGNKAIYVLHDPPYNVGLDLCKDGTLAGSKAIYKFILKSNAYMSLHGHIHESYELTGKWFVKIGNTIAIQPGQSELNQNPFHYVIIDTDNDSYDIYEINC